IGVQSRRCLKHKSRVPGFKSTMTRHTNISKRRRGRTSNNTMRYRRNSQHVLYLWGCSHLSDTSGFYVPSVGSTEKNSPDRSESPRSKNPYVPSFEISPTNMSDRVVRVSVGRSPPSTTRERFTPVPPPSWNNADSNMKALLAVTLTCNVTMISGPI
ncbi:hypothetical protein J6590_049857, partial [Homalodisca vitripennis]